MLNQIAKLNTHVTLSHGNLNWINLLKAEKELEQMDGKGLLKKLQKFEGKNIAVSVSGAISFIEFYEDFESWQDTTKDNKKLITLYGAGEKYFMINKDDILEYNVEWEDVFITLKNGMTVHVYEM